MSRRADLQHLRLWQDSPAGWHSFLLIREGHKFALFISTEDASTLKLSLPEWRDLSRTAKPLELRRTRMFKRLKALAITYSHETKLLKLALALLRQKDL